MALLFALCSGSISTSIIEVWDSIGNPQHPSYTLITQLRLPRALCAFSVGALLALSGVLMQVLLRNPLADPYILGVSGGAAVATLLSMLLGVGSAALTGSAMAGALLSMLLVFSLAHGHGGWTTTRLLLTGVIVASGWSAIISFILAVAPQQQLYGMLFWLLGDLSYSTHYGTGITVMLLGLAVGLALARDLNILSVGELQAAALGVNTLRLRVTLYVVASALSATAVTIAGSIGFIGLVIPHVIRLLGVHNHRWLIPSAASLGGVFLLLADTLARTVIAPIQLPVGVVTALMGVPVFLFLMHHSTWRT
jgi:iron complex transport system permease protein